MLLSPIFFREILSDLLRTGRPSRALYRPTDPHARVDASHAVSTIRQVIADGLASRALSKALRDCFRWRAETVTLYRDGPLDFLFTTASGCPAFGGLVRHETTIRTPVGTKPKVVLLGPHMSVNLGLDSSCEDFGGVLTIRPA